MAGLDRRDRPPGQSPGGLGSGVGALRAALAAASAKATLAVAGATFFDAGGCALLDAGQLLVGLLLSDAAVLDGGGDALRLLVDDHVDDIGGVDAIVGGDIGEGRAFAQLRAQIVDLDTCLLYTSPSPRD